MNLITENAAQDDLSEQDYLDMLSELLQTYTLRQLVDVLHSDYTFGAWAKYKTGERPLPRDAKNELRAALKLPLLPPTIEEAMRVVDANAKVYRKGVEAPDLVYVMNEAESGGWPSVAPATTSQIKPSNARKNERIFDMPMALLGWKIANREVIA